MKYIEPAKYKELIEFLTMGVAHYSNTSREEAEKEVLKQLNLGKSPQHIVNSVFKFANKPVPEKLPDDIQEILKELES